MIMTSSWCTLICAVLALQLISTEHPQSIKSGGNNYFLISCDSQQDSNCEDQTLDQVADNLTEHSPVLEDVTIYISTSCLELVTTVSFSGLYSLTISGSNTTIVCSLEDYGRLEFNNITSLILANLTITNCGFKSYPSTEQKQFLSYSSAVTILCCREVKVSNVIMRNNNGIGLKILNHQGGTVHIVSSTFSENKLLNESHLNDTSHKGGGGLYVGGFEHPHEPITFQFENCIFEENVAHTEYYDYLYTDDLGQLVTGYGLGGGAAIVLHEVLTDIHVIFSRCKFVGNLAFKGGGLTAGVKATEGKKISNISVLVENSLFEGNGCNSSSGNVTTSGGGMSIHFSSKKNPKFHSNKFTVHNVTFDRNCARFGGGLYFYSDNEVIMNSKNTVQIENSTFKGNRAHTGSAIDITPNVFQRLSLTKSLLTAPIFKDCEFINNSVRVNFHNQTTYGIGTLYVSLYNINFTGYNRFENNTGTAIHIVNGNIDMSHSSVYFNNNTGIQGGAIALIGQSSMIVDPNRTYKFINNTALGKGGGLYVQLDDNHDITASKSCFIQYFDADEYTTIISTGDQTAAIIFKGNRAETGTGHTIFATSLYPCQSINNGSLVEPQFIFIPSSKVFTMRGIIIEDEDEDDKLKDAQIATEGARLELENNSLEVIPGERFFHGVKVTDDLLHKANVTLIASIANDYDVRVDEAFSSCVGEQMMLKGAPNESAFLRLQTTTSRQSYIRLEVKLSECPPGFMFKKEESRCVCNHNEYDGFTKCNTTAFTSYMIPGYWAGKVCDENDHSKKELVTSYCPLNFCHYNKDASGSEIQLPQNYNDLNEAICGVSRKGISCASCASGYTTHFHSPNFECKNVTDTLCTIGWLFYILSELVPVTVVFITLLVFNINFTSGAVNGFILFSQILISLNIDASGFITPTSVITHFLKAHQFIYGLFNLDFFYAEYFSFCLWPNASALDMLAFKYITIVYILILMALVIWFTKKCNRGMKCLAKFCRFTTIKASVIHGISAFFILYYSQCLNVSLKLLRSYSLTTREGSNLTLYKRVWLNGNIIYFGAKHLPYALPALFCLLTIGLFPLIFLLVYPLLCKILSWFGYGESKLVTFISQKLSYNRLKPLLDSLQSCFTDDLRFFAGLYFLYRWIPLCLDVLTSRYHVFYTALEASIIIILTLHALCQPYTNKVHNIMDTLLFADLALINAITLAHYHIFRTVLSRQKAIEYINKTMAVQLVLIYLPLLAMMGYALWLVYRFVYRRKDSRKNFTSLYLLSSENSMDTITDDNDLDLPHRLITGDTDYKCFEDTDHATYDETDSFSLDVTY